jgi:hypothetical protein
MIAAGIWHLHREGSGVPVRIGGAWWSGGILGGATVIFVSFAMDYRNLMAGHMPSPFHWGIFTAGLGLGAASYAIAARKSLRTIQDAGHPGPSVPSKRDGGVTYASAAPPA